MANTERNKLNVDIAQNNSTEAPPNMLQEALRYREIGLRVLPLWPIETGHCSCPKGAECASPGKHPMLRDWPTRATDNAELITQWWTTRPSAGIGIATGGRFIVLDVDGADGERSIGGLEATHGQLPETPAVRTGRGWHLYYTAPEGIELRNGVALLPGLDLRAAGGFVVAPPSPHVSGPRYSWTEGLAVPMAPMPECLVALATKKREPTPPRAASGTNQRWAKAALESELAALRVAAEGSRNNTLNTCSFNLGQLVGGGVLNEMHVHDELLAVAASIGLEHGESLKTISSGLNAGMKSPRRAPESSSMNGASHSVTEPWPEPLPLPELPPVPQWNDMLLPETLRPWVADAAERMQAPTEYIAATAVVVASSLIGTGVAMRPRALDNWSVIANLWGTIIGAPATKKSPSKDEACRPFASIITADEGSVLAEIESRMFDASVTEAELSALKDRLKSLTKAGKLDDAQALKERFVELQRQLKVGQGGRRYVTSQCTPEALIKLLNENPRGLLLNRDELSGWFAAIDRPDHAADRKFFLECWNGYGSYDHDTKTSGHIHCESTCLSIIGCMTPGSLAGYMRAAMRGGSGADGMMQRFQVAVFPDRRIRRRVDRRPDQNAYELALQAFTRLAGLHPDDVGAQQLDDSKQPFLRFDSAAQVEWDAWEDALNARIDQGEYPEAFESHLSKYPSLASSLALIFHQLDKPKGGPVTLEALERALAWVQVLEAHAVRIYASAATGDDGTVRTLWKRIASGRLGASFTVRTLKQREWTGLTTDEAVEDALRQLVDHGWIRLVEEQNPKGGQPSRKVLVHPSVVAKWGNNG